MWRHHPRPQTGLESRWLHDRLGPRHERRRPHRPNYSQVEVLHPLKLDSAEIFIFPILFFRDTWKLSRDFVGHKKAVTSVRFNRQMFQTKDAPDDAFVMVAVGSRDRSFSVWATNLKRPFFVVSDAFDQSVLDLSWSKDGRVLIACSMDGSVAVVILSESESGKALSETKMYDIMSKNYGSSFGITNVKKKTNGTIFVENPELLTQTPEKENNRPYTNGASAAPENEIKVKKRPRGPTKQIEARTLDGKRRITPIYIPPDAEENSDKRGTDEFGSSSTQEKSKIQIEKRNEVVSTKNAQNGVRGESSKENSGSSPSPKEEKPKNDDNEKKVAAAAAKEPEPSKKEAAGSSKQTDSVKEEDKKPPPSKPKAPEPEPGVNLIAVKRKPGAPARRRIVISDSSDDEDAAQPTAKPQSGRSSPPVNTIIPKRKPTSSEDSAAAKASPTQNKSNKLKDLMQGSKPDLTNITVKRKIEQQQQQHESSDTDSAQPKKRGRTNYPPEDYPPSTSQHHQPQPLEIPGRSRVAISSDELMTSSTVLTPLRLVERVSNVILNISNESYTINVMNNYHSLGNKGQIHQIRCGKSFPKEEIWSTLLSSEITYVDKCDSSLIVACLDASFHVFNPISGLRLFPAIMMPAALTKVCVAKDAIAAITTTAKFFLWKLNPESGLTSILRNECILSLLQHTEPVSILKLNFSDSNQPVIMTSAMKSFVFNSAVGAWLKLSDSCNAVQAISNYSAPSVNCPPPTDSSGYQMLSATVTASSSSSLSQIPADCRHKANVSYCEEQKIAAQFANSPKEFKFWLLNIIRHLAGSADEKKLREHLDGLLGLPTPSGSNWKPEVMGMNKLELLREALKIVAGNVGLQRLHMEYHDQVVKRSKTTTETDDSKAGAAGDATAMEIDNIFKDDK